MKDYQLLPPSAHPQITEPEYKSKEAQDSDQRESIDDSELQGLIHADPSTTEKGEFPKDSRYSRTLSIACYLALFVSLLNLARMTWERIDVDTSCRDVASLKRPTLYPGLEKLARNESSPGYPLIAFGYPRVIGAVFETEPSKASLDPTHVLIRPGISSIFEYRIGDIDLETCKFGAWFPTADRALPKTYEVSAATSEVDVWLLDAKDSQSFAAGSLTWSNKPPRKQFLGRLKINPGGNSTLMDAYYCATSSIQLVEVACVPHAGSCSIDLKQDTRYPKIGFRMKILEGTPEANS